MTQIRVEHLESAEAFDAVAPQWNALLRSSASDCIFLSFEWLSTWWKFLGGERRLQIVLVWRGDELVGAAPLAVRRRRVFGWLTAPCLEFLGVGSVGSDYLDVILCRDAEDVAAHALLADLRRRGALLDLGQLSSGRAAAGRIALGLGERGWRQERAVVGVCPYIDLRGQTWATYLAGLGSAHRYALRRKLRRLSERPVSFSEARSDFERRAALDTLIALHNQRWDERGGSEAFYTPGLVMFHRTFSRLALARGWLRLFVLRVDGEPAAAFYGFRYGPRFSFYQSGFAPAAARDGVGTVCMAFAIQRAIEEGALEYDFLHGDEAYKFHWARQVRTLERLQLFPPRLAGALWKGAVGLDRKARRMARRVLPAPVVERLTAARREREVRDVPVAAEG